MERDGRTFRERVIDNLIKYHVAVPDSDIKQVLKDALHTTMYCRDYVMEREIVPSKGMATVLEIRIDQINKLLEDM